MGNTRCGSIVVIDIAHTPDNATIIALISILWYKLGAAVNANAVLHYNEAGHNM